MPAPTQDLNYQPETKEFSYAPKTSIFEKIGKHFKTFGKLLSVLLLALLVLIVIILPTLALNYFRIISLSSISPVFNNLPKPPPTTAEILSDAKFIKEGNDWQIEAKFYKIENDKIIVKYKGKLVSFSKDPSIMCLTTVTKIIPKAQNQSFSQIGFCSDILENNNNSGKNANIIYKSNGKGNFQIETITLE